MTSKNSKCRQVVVHKNNEIDFCDNGGHFSAQEQPLRTLSVQGQGETKCPPDNFLMNISLCSSKASLQEAEASVKKRLDYILQVLRNHGITNECVNITTSVSDKSAADSEDLCQYNTTISATGTDYGRMAQARQVLNDKLSTSVQCSNIRCQITFKQRTFHREEAFKDAVVSAKSKGVSVSKCLGVELGPVLTLVEDSMEESPLRATEQGHMQTAVVDPAMDATMLISCSISAVFELLLADHTNHNNKKS